MTVAKTAGALKLLGPAWTRAFRCVWMLEELQIPYEIIGDALPFSDEAKKYNPSGKIPILLQYDGHDAATAAPSFVLTESVAINTYLGDLYPESRLVPPSGTRERAVYNETVSCILSEIDSQGLWLHRKHSSNSQGNPFGYIPDAVEAARKQFHRMNKEVASRLATKDHERDGSAGGGGGSVDATRGGPYLLGEQFTAADILYIHCLDWAKGIGWHTKWPDSLVSYRKLCHDRPAYQRAKELRDRGKSNRKDPLAAPTMNKASKL